MDYRNTFSYCLKGKKPESKHQFHYQYNYEPSDFEFEQWLVGKLYCITLMEEIEGYVYAVDYDYPIEKEKQIHDFLDFHFSKYKSNLVNFKLSLKFAIELLKGNPSVNKRERYYDGINGFIFDWISRKTDHRDTTKRNKPMNFPPICKADKIKSLFDFLNHSYLSEISDINHFYYVFGITDRCTDFKPLNWIKSIKALNAFINTFYLNEPRKWKKAVYCFTCNNNPIKEKSLSTAMDKHDTDPESMIYFDNLHKELK